MTDKQKSFLIYNDLIHTAKHLSKEQLGDLFLSILEFANGNEFSIEDPIVKIAFEPVKQTLIRDKQKYEKYIEKQSKNGKKGGRPRKTQKTQPFLEKPKKADSVTVNNSVNESLSSSKNEIINRNDKTNNGSLVVNILKYFSLTDKCKNDVQEFIDKLETENLLDHFRNQSKAYTAYKKLSGEKIHSFSSYKKEWQNTDWVKKLADYKKKKLDNLPETEKRKLRQQSEVDMFYRKFKRVDNENSGPVIPVG